MAMNNESTNGKNCSKDNNEPVTQASAKEVSALANNTKMFILSPDIIKNIGIFNTINIEKAEKGIFPANQILQIYQTGNTKNDGAYTNPFKSLPFLHASNILLRRNTCVKNKSIEGRDHEHSHTINLAIHKQQAEENVVASDKSFIAIRKEDHNNIQVSRYELNMKQLQLSSFKNKIMNIEKPKVASHQKDQTSKTSVCFHIQENIDKCIGEIPVSNAPVSDNSSLIQVSKDNFLPMRLGSKDLQNEIQIQTNTLNLFDSRNEQYCNSYIKKDDKIVVKDGEIITTAAQTIKSVPLQNKVRVISNGNLSKQIEKTAKEYATQKSNPSEKNNKRKLCVAITNDISNRSEYTNEDVISVKRGRGHKASGGRSRGRGQERRNVSLHIDYQSMYIQSSATDLIETRLSISNDENSKDITINVELVKCSRCNKHLPSLQWPSHNLSVHNNMAWREGDESMNFENDVKLLRRVLMTAKKTKGQLTCEQCGVAKRSADGFISHLQFCGKTDEEREALMVTCSICQKVMMPSSMESHKRYHRNLDENKNACDKTMHLGSKRCKRVAAVTAMSKILEVTSTREDEKQSAEEKMKSAASLFMHVIDAPDIVKNVPSVVMGIWKKEIISKGSTACRQPGCDFTNSCYAEMSKHYLECKFTPQSNFDCRICKFSTISKEEVLNHVLKKHASGNTDKDPSDYERQSNDFDESTCKSQDEEINIPAVISKAVSERIKHASKICHINNGLSSRVRWRKSYTPALLWTLQFELKNYDLQLFDGNLPNTFQLLNNEDTINYLPELKISMNAKRANASLSKCEATVHTEWKRWKRFEGTIDADVPTFFVGGPVWALAWLPIPLPLHNSETTQYIAVSTHPSMETEYAVGQAYTGCNMIQIWNVGVLNHKARDTHVPPSLSYAIVHNGGTVWCLEWCPSGCYQDSNLQNYATDESKMKRMGMLAAACSDGCIRVYSLPFPSQLAFEKTEKHELPVYKTDPTLILIVNTAMYDVGRQSWQCTKLSWSKENGHNIIAAGFSNGYIALWDLIEQSPLCRQQRGDTIFINAFKHFYAHGNAVSVVSFLPYNGKRFLCSASIDRTYKLWDLEDVSFPQEFACNCLTTDGLWLLHWYCAIICFDDALKLGRSNTYIHPLRQRGHKYLRVLRNSAPTYSVSVSDHANGIVHGTLSGDILSVFPHEILYSKGTKSTLHKQRYLKSFIKIEDFQESEHDSITSIKRNKIDKKKSQEYHYKPETYDECKDRFGIIFHDYLNNPDESMHRVTSKQTEAADQLSSIPIEQYPFTSANRLSWNSNAWSYLWLVVGYQNGLVRLLNFKFMDVETTDTLVAQYANLMFNRTPIKE